MATTLEDVRLEIARRKIQDEISLRQDNAIETPINTPSQPVTQRQQGSDGWINDIIDNRWQKTADMVGRNITDGKEGFGYADVYHGVKNAPKMGVLAAGQVAGGVSDVIGGAAVRGLGAVTPEPVKEFGKEKITSIAQSEAGQAIADLAGGARERWDTFAGKYPDAAMTLEAALNLGEFGIIKKGAKEIESVVVDTVKKATPIPKAAIDRKIKQELRQGIQKGTRPGVEGKRTFSQSEKYFKNAQTAVEAIIDNKQNLSLVDDAGDVVANVLPKNLRQFSQSIEQTKRGIYKQYTELAGQTGGVLDTSNVVKELRDLASNQNVGMVDGRVSQYAARMADKLEGRGPLSAMDAQEIIQSFNAKLDAYWREPKFDDAMRQSVDALMANNLRKNLDGMIESATGKQYQKLRSQYGALKAIERDVNRRMIVDLRKEVKGLLDFTDIATSAQAVYAIVNKNPALFAAGATAKGVASWYKRLKDPNRAISKMFENIDELKSKRADTKPRSMSFSAYEEMMKTKSKLKEVKDTPVDPLRGANLSDFGQQYPR